jgi:NAD(P)-dependent dehydrogenase (short-subunit alcohol dehydrogenase family)
MAGRLEGKVAAITGAASGIGRAAALIFAREGAAVAVLDCDDEGGGETVRRVGEAGGKAVFQHTDVSREEDIVAAVAATTGEFGRLDILVNNAGVVLMANAPNTSVEDWDRIQAINLRGVFLGCKHAIPVMQAQGGGAIVNTASIGALVAVPVHAAYDAAKAGVLGLTRQLAVDHGPDNIRVNCVCPTATDTPLVRGAGANDAALEALAKMHPLRRVAQPEDVAHAMLFLASDEARCVTGAALPVDAGWTAQ